METIVTGSGNTEVGEVITSSPSEIDGNISVVHVQIPNQPVQVQSVIQPAQQSVIQTAGQTIQTIQHEGRVYRTIQLVTPVAEDADEDLASRSRREILARRPSYRKILNELSESPQAITVTKIEEESNSSQTSQESSQEGNEAATNLSTNATTPIVVPAQTIQIAAHGDGATTQGLQTLTMTNVNTSQASTPGATIVQYAQGPDGQFFIPAGAVQAYQISTPTSLPQGVVMATTGTTIASPQQLSEEAARKRELRLLKNRCPPPTYQVAMKQELRLLKNRDAARECRRKRKEYVRCLENRVAVLENQNRSLIEELRSLKELYCQQEVDAARECRRKKKDYVKCLENRVAVLENQNKALIEELKSLKELYCQKE